MLLSSKGKFIVFEGADCLGKTTQIQNVYNRLSEEGKKVIITREPGRTKLGSKIREILLNSEEAIPKQSELLLFLADRANHYHSFIKPYLEKQYIILCDRFYLSTLVYQHKLRGIDEEFILNLNRWCIEGFEPDKVFVFYGNRLNQDNRDLFEKSLGNNTHKMLNDYYYEYGERFGYTLIHANKEKDTITKEIIEEMRIILQ